MNEEKIWARKRTCDRVLNAKNCAKLNVDQGKSVEGSVVLMIMSDAVPLDVSLGRCHSIPCSTSTLQTKCRLLLRLRCVNSPTPGNTMSYTVVTPDRFPIENCNLLIVRK